MAASGQLYIIQDERLWRVNAATGQYVQLGDGCLEGTSLCYRRWLDASCAGKLTFLHHRQKYRQIHSKRRGRLAKADRHAAPVEPGLSSLKDWTGDALHSLHELHRNALTANCASYQPSLPDDAIPLAVFNFPLAQGVVVLTGRSLPVSSNRPLWTALATVALAEIAVELLLMVRKTFTRAPGAPPQSTVCSPNMVGMGRKGF
jgi:hypothetical protein